MSYVLKKIMQKSIIKTYFQYNKGVMKHVDD